MHMTEHTIFPCLLLIICFIISSQITIVATSPSCNIVTFSYDLCKTDTRCNAQLIENYNTLPNFNNDILLQFSYIIDRIINHNAAVIYPESPLINTNNPPLSNSSIPNPASSFISPSNLLHILQTQLCTDSSVQLLWLLILRNSYVCNVNQIFDRVEGCLCLDSKICPSFVISPSSQTSFTSFTYTLLPLLGIFILLAYLVNGLTTRQLQYNFFIRFFEKINNFEYRWKTSQHVQSEIIKSK